MAPGHRITGIVLAPVLLASLLADGCTGTAPQGAKDLPVPARAALATSPAAGNATPAGIPPPLPVGHCPMIPEGVPRVTVTPDKGTGICHCPGT